MFLIIQEVLISLMLSTVIKARLATYDPFIGSKSGLKRKKMKKYIMFVFLGLICLLVVGCQKEEKKSMTKHSLSLNSQDGEFTSLHPHKYFGIKELCLGNLIFEGLTRLDVNGDPILAGAEAVTISPDGRQYLFTLRDTKWSDGTPVTAYDYENAWRTAVKPVSPCARAQLFYKIKNMEEIKKGSLPLSDAGVRALDKKTLFVELAHPSPIFLKLLTHTIFSPLKDPEEEPREFNGAFFISSWKKNEKLLLKNNPFFWNSAQVKLESIDFSFVPEATTSLYLFEGGHIDWIGAPLSPLSLEAVQDLENKQTLLKRNSSRFLWLYINLEKTPFHSQSFRHALSLSLNRDLINRHITGRSLTVPLPPSLTLATENCKENIQQAKELFSQSLEELGITRENLEPLELRYFTHPRITPLALYLQQTWQDVLGIKVNLICSDWNTFRNALQIGDYQLGAFYETPACPEALNILERFEELGSANLCRWHNPLYQEKISLARNTSDVNSLKEAEEMLVLEAPIIPISSEIQTYSHHPSLKGYVFDFSEAVDFSYAYFEK